VLLVGLETAAREPCVYSDLRMSGYIAARHLITRGYRRLIMFSPVTLEFVGLRLEGIRQAIADVAEPEVSLTECVLPRGSAQDAYREGTRLGFDPLLLNGRPGIIAANDLTAYSILEIAAARGLRAGEDFGLVGFDDWESSRAQALTTLRPPVDAIGAEAAQNVLRALRGHPVPSELCIQWQLIPRSSSKAPLNGVRPLVSNTVAPA
jgi:LacI family transcriptional regulator